jgi:AcrR family transcriptional regulator
MARPKTLERRNAILDAASETIALRGVSASTAAIANKTGVSEGTIFTYFPTKDELLNALYRELKFEISDLLMSGFPRRASVRHRIQHIWNRYVEWGSANFSKFQALQQLTIWSGLTDEAKAAGIQQFENIRQIYADAMAQHLWRPLSEEHVGLTMTALSEMTINIIRKYPAEAIPYRETGFALFWGALRKE